jgi:hypothetical protein
LIYFGNQADNWCRSRTNAASLHRGKLILLAMCW